MERKIGETFEYEGTTLQVKEIAEHTCEGCFFTKLCNEKISIGVTGNCFDRTDGKDVIFAELRKAPEEEQKINLLEILKYCPEGMEFWSPIIGAVSFSRIDDGRVFFKSAYGTEWDFNPDSTITFRFDERNKQTSPEPMIFPSREQRDWTKVNFEKKKELPKTWEEFCEQNEIREWECFIDDCCDFKELTKEGGAREKKQDRNLLPSREAAEAHLALMQLHQLRDAWREGWVPDWNDGDQNKYVIAPNEGEFMIYKYHTIGRFLAFQDKKRADKFRNCFIDLIRKAGNLI